MMRVLGFVGLAAAVFGLSAWVVVLPLPATDEPFDVAEPPLCQVLTANFSELAKGNDYVEYRWNAPVSFETS